MESKINQLRTLLENRKGEYNHLKKEVKSKIRENKRLIKDLKNHEKALEIIKQVSKKTQEKLQYHFSDITSLALEAVLDNPYELKVEFVERRNKIECDLYFERDGARRDPMKEAGGGAADIASFALRIASWALAKSRNTIILDEPFKNLDKSKHEKASKMLKEISIRLGIQFIIVTHEQALTEAADRVFEVTKKRKISKVNQLT